MSEDGIASVVRQALPDIDDLVSRGDFTDSKALAALLLFERYRISAR